MILSSIYKSLIRGTVDIIDEINTTDVGRNVAYHSWESRSDENDLPHQTLLGVDSFMFEENKGRWIIRYSLGLSSYHDANLLNELEILDILHERTGEGKKTPLLDPVTGDILSELVTSAWQLAPMAQSEFRNYRTISIELLRTANSDTGPGR
jgi:hypothetical protein